MSPFQDFRSRSGFANWYLPTIPVLELGTFTGFSAMAWYEGTKTTKAEIVTLDIRSEVLESTKKALKEHGVEDRITLVEGPASET